MPNSTITQKLILLKFISMSQIPLSRAQINDFIADAGYMDYFSFQSALGSITENKLVDESHTSNNTLYSINEKGLDTLNMFPEKISSDIFKDIKSYYNDNSIEIKKSSRVYAYYDKAEGGGYKCSLVMRDDTDRDIMSLDFSVTTEELAKTICTNWKQKKDEIYYSILDHLVF